MIVACHQLHYLPWLRYFHKIANADIFVVLDNIQFNKNGWQNRNKIKNANGWMYLTVPIIHKYQQKIDEVMINNNKNWGKKHWHALKTNYSKAKYFNMHAEFFYKIYEKHWTKLADINYEILFYLLKSLKIDTKIIKSSELKNIEGEDTLRLINICKMLGADSYLSGAYALEVYLDADLFQKHGIKLLLQDWHCPGYKQLFPKSGFIPDLSIIDLLFNEGENSLEILNKDGRIREYTICK